MSTKGRAAIYVEPNQPLVVDEVEFADPGPDQVLVKIFSSGVCHSQLHTMQRPARRGRVCRRCWAMSPLALSSLRDVTFRM